MDNGGLIPFFSVSWHDRELVALIKVILNGRALSRKEHRGYLICSGYAFFSHREYSELWIL